MGVRTLPNPRPIWAGGQVLGHESELTVHGDDRGSVRESYRESWLAAPPIRQLVHSESRPRTVRGMHLHKRQWDIWHFTSTPQPVLVRLHDHRTGADAVAAIDGSRTIYIPPGISHGFYAPDGCTLVYALTEEYDGTDEFGWYFEDGTDDPDWPTLATPGLRISDRDLKAPRLKDFAA